MSELHLAQIRRHLEDHYLPHVDVTGADQEHHQLSRAVAALALAERTGLPEMTSAKSVTDHSRDGGIDGVAYAADRATLVLVQSKWTDVSNSGIGQGDVLKFIRGVEQLVSNSWGAFDGPLRDRRTEIEDILFQPGTKLELVIATTGTPDLDTIQKEALRDFCARMNDTTEIATHVLLNQERLYAAVASSRSAQIDLSVNLRSWGSYQETGYVAYYGTTSAQEVVSWYKTHGDLLFSRNIRGALVGTDVNDAIAATAREDPSRFWFFNNGITIIAESFDQAPYINQKSANFSFRKASVVNGAQTVNSLAHAAQERPSLLASADVFVKFVTLEDPEGEFARLVTRRTNTQNRVGGREFVALDPEQERLRMEFSVSNLRYAYRSGETVTDPAKGCDLSDATIALACATGIYETVLAKREISRLWENTAKAPYKALFNASVSGAYIWMAVELMRWIDDAIEVERSNCEDSDRLIVVHGNRLVTWAAMEHLGLSRVRTTNAFEVPFARADVHACAALATSELVKLVNEVYPGSYPQPLFKNHTKCRHLGGKLLERMANRSASPRT